MIVDWLDIATVWFLGVMTALVIVEPPKWPRRLAPRATRLLDGKRFAPIGKGARR